MKNKLKIRSRTIYILIGVDILLIAFAIIIQKSSLVAYQRWRDIPSDRFEIGNITVERPEKCLLLRSKKGQKVLPAFVWNKEDIDPERYTFRCYGTANKDHTDTEILIFSVVPVAEARRLELLNRMDDNTEAPSEDGCRLIHRLASIGPVYRCNSEYSTFTEIAQLITNFTHQHSDWRYLLLSFQGKEALLVHSSHYFILSLPSEKVGIMVSTPELLKRVVFVE